MAKLTDQNNTTPSTEIPELVPYEPPLEIINNGSTSLIGRLKPGVVLKFPRYSWWHSETAESHTFVRDIKHSFCVEEQILRILGDHPRIVRFLGGSKSPRGLLLVEATDGDLQSYIDHHHATIDISLQMKWCSQAAEAIQYIHLKGVVHSDLRPDSFLLHTTPYSSKSTPDLLLCDFGRSTCGSINGRQLPDSGSGIFDPGITSVATEAADIERLGWIYYTIMTGPSPHETTGDSISSKKVMGDGQYPCVEGVLGGEIIRSCWEERYKNMDEVIGELNSAFKTFITD
ncbi:hypothetical protein BDV12DRAFT_188113 [Aspergillus spectabilis]